MVGHSRGSCVNTGASGLRGELARDQLVSDELIDPETWKTPGTNTSARGSKDGEVTSSTSSVSTHHHDHHTGSAQ